MFDFERTSSGLVAPQPVSQADKAFGLRAFCDLVICPLSTGGWGDAGEDENPDSNACFILYLTTRLPSVLNPLSPIRFLGMQSSPLIEADSDRRFEDTHSPFRFVITH
jgi:hypothetical protein